MINYLRNVAFSVVNTPYAFVVDADFTPSRGMYERLQQHIRDHHHNNTALIVPAFQVLDPRLTSVPDDKRALLKRMMERNIVGAKYVGFRSFRTGFGTFRDSLIW